VLSAPPTDPECDYTDNKLIAPYASALALITSFSNEGLDNLDKLATSYQTSDPPLYHDEYGFRNSVRVDTEETCMRFVALHQQWEAYGLFGIDISADENGNPKDYFNPEEDVYGKALLGIEPSTEYPLYVVVDVSIWADQMPIPERIAGSRQSFFTNNQGDMPAGTVILEFLPQTPSGVCDIIIDTDNDGLFDANTDFLDSVVLETLLKVEIEKVCGAPSQSVDVPVKIGFLKPGLEIISLDITITYDADSGWTENNPSLGQLAQDAGWTITFNMSPGQDVITINGATPIGDDGEIITLHFVAGDSPGATDLNITAVTSTDSEYNDIPMEQFAIVSGKLDVGGITLSITSGCIEINLE
jgi:hypothetical protein